MALVGLKAENLLDVAKKMEDAANRIEASMARIDNVMADMNEVWNDNNSKNYLNRYEDLKGEFPKFKQSVREYSEFLHRVVDTYKKEFLDETSTTVS